MQSLNPCHPNCDVGDIGRAVAGRVEDDCEYPRRGARRPLRHCDRHAEARVRRGNGVSERPLNRHLDPVLLRHGCHWPELERPYVPPLEAGDQLCLGMASEQLVVKGDESFCSPLQDSIEPIEPREEIVSTGSSLGLQVTGESPGAQTTPRSQSGEARHQSTVSKPVAP